MQSTDTQSAQTPLPQPPTSLLPSNPLLQLLRGMGYPLYALYFIHKNGLWALAMLPVLVNVLLIVVLGLIFWLGGWPVLEALQHYLHSWSSDIVVFQHIIPILIGLVWLVLLPIMFVVSTVIVCMLGQVFASPFLDILSERVEGLILHQPVQAFGLRRLFDSIFWSLGDVFLGGLYLLMIYIPLLLLGLIPGLGAVLSVAFGALLLSQQFVGIPMARQLISYRARWRLILDNKWFCIGLGSILMLMLALPVLNLLLLPAAAVAGTLMYCDLKSHGRLASLV